MEIARVGPQLESQANELVYHGQNREAAEPLALVAHKELGGLIVEEEDDAGAQEEVDEHVEGHKAHGVELREDFVADHQGRSAILDEGVNVTDDVVVIKELEEHDDAESCGAVDDQLPFVVPLGEQLRHACNEEEEDRKGRKELHDADRQSQHVLGGRIHSCGQLERRNKHFKHEQQPADDLEVAVI